MIVITSLHRDFLPSSWGMYYPTFWDFSTFFGYYSANKYEGFMIWNRMTGPYWPYYWTLVLCNIVTPQLLWIRSFRTSPVRLFMIAMVVNVGMWLERFVIVITSLHRDFLPSSWGMYYPTIWDFMTFFGTIGYGENVSSWR